MGDVNDQTRKEIDRKVDLYELDNDEECKSVERAGPGHGRNQTMVALAPIHFGETQAVKVGRLRLRLTRVRGTIIVVVRGRG